MKTRGVITLVFDDGYEQVFQTVLPLLRQYHFPAVFALPLETTSLEKNTGQKIRLWENWLAVLPEGHEIAAHTTSHIDLTTLSAQEIQQELAEPAKKLQATTLVYPGGATNDQVVQSVRKYYTAARGLNRAFESLSPANPFNLNSYDFTRANFSVAKANTLALRALLTNSWLIETYHLIDDQESKLKHTVQLSALASHLRFLSSLPVAVRTIKDVVN